MIFLVFFFGGFPAAWVLTQHGGWWGMAGFGIYSGFVLVLFWAIGSLVETVEYQEGRTSHWLQWPFATNKPTRMASLLPRRINERKLMSAMGSVVGVVFGVLGEASEPSFPICLAATWILGVCWAEYHFRRYYTLAKT